MENNFDNFFKDKLEHRKFEMKPEYWEGAEALIEADEKTGDWRRFILWFGVVLVAGLGVFFIWKNDNSNIIVESEKKSNTTLGNVIAPTSEKDKNEIEISSEKISDEKNKLSGIIENKKLEKNTADLKNTKPLNESSDVFSKTIPSSKSSVNNLEDNNNSSGVKNNNVDVNAPTFISKDKNQSNQSGRNTAMISDQKEDDKKLIPLTRTATPSTNNENVKKEEIIIAPPIASTSTILLPFLEMFLANNKKVEKLDLEAVCPFTPQRNKFAYGIFVGAVGYPLVDNSSETPFIGFKTGFLIEHNFEIGKANMALGAELAYHYRSGNFVATKQNEVRNYSFGRSVAQAKLTPENLHYLELPLYLKYQNKRMAFETGASFNYLLGVRGKITGVDGVIQSGLVPSVGFKKNHVNVLLGFHYRISDNLHFGVRANYTPGGILDKGAILPDGVTVALQESKPLYLTFRVTQYLNLKR
ncbi:MAG: outer membrane beta-barrel protein [Saprospiraceae bacterium]